MEQINFEGRLYQKEAGLHNIITTFDKNLRNRTKKTQEVNGGELYSNRIMVNELSKDDDTGMLVMNVHLLIRNLKSYFFKGWTPKQSQWHAFECSEMKEISSPGPFTNIKKYEGFLDKRKYLLFAFLFKQHMQLIVGTNKLQTLWICNSADDDKYTKGLKNQLKDMVKNYMQALGRPYKEPNFRKIQVAGQPGTYECGYLTVINAIKVLKAIRKHNKMPTSLIYVISDFTLYKKKLAEISKIIIEKYIATQIMKFKSALLNMFTEEEIDAELTVTNYPFLKYVEFKIFKKALKHEYRYIANN